MQWDLEAFPLTWKIYHAFPRGMAGRFERGWNQPVPRPPAWKSHGSENRLHAVRLCNFQAGGAWNWAIPCWGKVAVARGKCGLGKVANTDWHEISACVIKTQRFKNSKSCYFFTLETHDGSSTFLHLAFSPVFRILHKNGSEPIRQKKPIFSVKETRVRIKEPDTGVREV
jgi:hypothetical protein